MENKQQILNNGVRALLCGEQPSTVKVSALPKELQVQYGAQQRTGDHTTDAVLSQGKAIWASPARIGGSST